MDTKIRAVMICASQGGSYQGLRIARRNGRAVRLAVLFVSLAIVLAGFGTTQAQRNLKNIPDPDPELERQTFRVPDGIQVELYAADPLIAKPIHMNFDGAGRLWIASSTVYPHIKPGQPAEDRILVVEDTDQDGRADKVESFADGLLIPTGILPGDGGVYVANSTELVHFSDTNGDGRADQRRTVLSGFGTEDTHHLLHTLRWGPDGMMYMNQSIYIHSHVETPWGVRRMDGGGTWVFRPETLELETFMLGLCNPWGHVFDMYGQSLQTDGAGGEGINHTFPGYVGFTSPGAKRILHGKNPGSPKYCGLEIVSGRHFPPAWQGNLITNDFRANRVCRYVLADEGSSFAAREQQELIQSDHVAFRPIDVKMGPDGALYIADWYNPIIQHGEVDFRDPRRDHVHGRIWRVTVAGRPLSPRVDIPSLSEEALCALLTVPEQHIRLQARIELKQRPRASALAALDQWVAQWDPADPTTELTRLEALWTYQALRYTHLDLLRQLLIAQDFRVRAAATRVLAWWHAETPDALTLLDRLVVDEHPRVRLEAVRALSRLSAAEACEVAMRALELPRDEFLDFAIWRTARDLEAIWMPRFRTGELDFGGNVEQATFALQAVEAVDAGPLLLEQLEQEAIAQDRRRDVVELVCRLADSQLADRLYARAVDAATDPDERQLLLVGLADAALQRGVVPTTGLETVATLIQPGVTPTVRAAACRLAGAWKQHQLQSALVAAAFENGTTRTVRVSAVEGLVLLGETAKSVLKEQAERGTSPHYRALAVAGMARLDFDQAARLAGAVLALSPATADVQAILHALLARRGGATALAAALDNAVVDGVLLDGDTARAALQIVRSDGRSHEDLLAALARAGNLPTSPRVLSPETAAALLELSEELGDPVLGEAIFRRRDLNCQKCHAIGGAGGQVGPDLSSIGASAQRDYLIEALLEPAAKVKENYHAVICFTNDGGVVSGVKVRQTDTQLLLRDAEDRLLQVPLADIEEQQDGGSLMPRGLTDSLSDDELAHLVRFLDTLGTPGPFSLPKQAFVRTWRILRSDMSDVPRETWLERVSRDDPSLNWDTHYSNVAGALPVWEVTPADSPAQTVESFVVRFQLDVTSAGQVRLQWGDDLPARLWVAGHELATNGGATFSAEAGVVPCLLVLEDVPVTTQLRVQVVEQGENAARVQVK